MLKINKKLKQAREMVGLTQQQLAEWMNVSAHSLISQYENGKKSGISEEYIDFLLNHKFDLNSLFDNEKELQRFTDEDIVQIVEKKSLINIATQSGNNLEDKYVVMLQLQVEDLKKDKLNLQKTIDVLQDELQANRSNTNGRAKSA